MLPMRTTPPFRADHVGSLLRPARVLTARADYATGHISAERLRAVEDDAIADVVTMQQNVGLRSATDGEFRRASWHMDFIYQIGGVSKAPGNLAVRFHNPGGAEQAADMVGAERRSGSHGQHRCAVRTRRSIRAVTLRRGWRARVRQARPWQTVRRQALFAGEPPQQGGQFPPLGVAEARGNVGLVCRRDLPDPG